MRLLCLAAAAAAVILACPAAAQQAGPTEAEPVAPSLTEAKADFARRKALAGRYFDAMNALTITTAMTDAMMRSDPGMAEDKGRRERIMAIVREVQAKYWPEVIDRASDHYARIFNEDELVALVGFYESPVGRAIVAKSTADAGTYTESMADLMQRMQIEMLGRILEEYARDKPLTESAGPA